MNLNPPPQLPEYHCRTEEHCVVCYTGQCDISGNTDDSNLNIEDESKEEGYVQTEPITLLMPPNETLNAPLEDSEEPPEPSSELPSQDT
jgi:hypothetical protein